MELAALGMGLPVPAAPTALCFGAGLLPWSRSLWFGGFGVSWSREATPQAQGHCRRMGWENKGCGDCPRAAVVVVVLSSLSRSFPVEKKPLLLMGIKEKQLKAAVIPAQAPVLCLCSRCVDRCWLCQEVVSVWLEGRNCCWLVVELASALGKSQNDGEGNRSSHSYES